MNTIKTLRFCGVVCLLCGIIITCIVFTEGDCSTYRKIIGPLQIVVGSLFLLSAKFQKRNL